VTKESVKFASKTDFEASQKMAEDEARETQPRNVQRPTYRNEPEKKIPAPELELLHDEKVQSVIHAVTVILSEEREVSLIRIALPHPSKTVLETDT
jgi:hypothetical protein